MDVINIVGGVVGLLLMIYLILVLLKPEIFL